MRLTYRKAEYEDLFACFDIYQDSYYTNPTQHASLPRLWREWTSDGAMLGCVVEESDRPVSERIVAHGMVLFLKDSFVDELFANPQPYVSERVIDLAVAGNSPVLKAAEVARANANQGLNILNVHGAVRHLQSSSSLYNPIIDELQNSYYWRFSGFNIRQQLAEAVSTHMLHWLFSSGFILRSDFSEYYKSNSNVDTDLRRNLVGINRDEVLAYPGTRVCTLYTFGRPTLHLSPSHQELLELAVMGEDDHSAGKILCISHPAVKKRWLAIYDAIREIDPSLLGEDDSSNEGSETRGAEKRRHLLKYLRQHPEELKPYSKD